MVLNNFFQSLYLFKRIFLSKKILDVWAEVVPEDLKILTMFFLAVLNKSTSLKICTGKKGKSLILYFLLGLYLKKFNIFLYSLQLKL